ncbi:PH domain-containing protein [Salinactinospora qingdaonensis]|uniref:PH domain-containing protein n=1 Tax=Salinactinospora qingdaonensis TaxID=702744 RepID=A0ABP7G3L6_9ACTN
MALIGLPALAAAVILALVGLLLWAVLTPLAAALLSVALVGTAVLRYRRTHYRVTGERMEMRSGLLSRTHLSLPRERIRSVDLATPVWARPLGLCQVTVGTGQSSHSHSDELKLAYVSAADGDRLRRDLLARAAPSPQAPTAQRQARRNASPVLAEMRPAWFGYGFAAQGPAAVAYPMVVGGTASFSELLFQWALRLYLPTGQAPGIGAVVAIVLTLAAGSVVVGAVVAMVLHIEAWSNYRLTREPDGTLRVTRGLLNLSSVSIEERRLRGVRLCTPLPLRWFGAATVAAIASGLGQEGGKNSGLVPKRSLSPDVPREEAERIAGRALPGAAFGTLTAHPSAALRRRLVRAGVAVVGLAGATVALVLLTSAHSRLPEVPLWSAAVVFVLSAPIAALYAWGSYRGLGHGLSERHLYLRRGMLARSTAVLNRDAVIGWTIRRSPLQRRAGLATIGATIAADEGVCHAVDAATGQGLALAEEAVPGLLTPFLERD